MAALTFYFYIQAIHIQAKSSAHLEKIYNLDVLVYQVTYTLPNTELMINAIRDLFNSKFPKLLDISIFG